MTRRGGDHRKYAIGLLTGGQPPRRRPTDSAEAISILAWLWEQSGSRCATRVKAARPMWPPWVRQRRLYGTTRPWGGLLNPLVPLKTDHGAVPAPGALAVDRGAHSGAAAIGDFLHPVAAGDMHTGWVERQAVRGQGPHGSLPAPTTLDQQRPVALRGLDADNGSECRTRHLGAVGQRPGARALQVTRSRPYTNDATAQGEQQTWTHVRTLVGWARDEPLEAPRALNARSTDLRLFQNLFPPSMKLPRHERRGAAGPSVLARLRHGLGRVNIRRTQWAQERRSPRQPRPIEGAVGDPGARHRLGTSFS